MLRSALAILTYRDKTSGQRPGADIVQSSLRSSATFKEDHVLSAHFANFLVELMLREGPLIAEKSLACASEIVRGLEIGIYPLLECDIHACLVAPTT